MKTECFQIPWFGSGMRGPLSLDGLDEGVRTGLDLSEAP